VKKGVAPSGFRLRGSGEGKQQQYETTNLSHWVSWDESVGEVHAEEFHKEEQTIEDTLANSENWRLTGMALT